MSNEQVFGKGSESNLILTVLAIILGCLALGAALFSWKSTPFIAVSLLLSLPSIILSVLHLSRGQTFTGISITNLILNKAAWVVMSCLLIWKFYEVVINWFI